MMNYQKIAATSSCQANMCWLRLISHQRTIFPTSKGLLAYSNVYFANVPFHFEKMHSSLGESWNVLLQNTEPALLFATFSITIFRIRKKIQFTLIRQTSDDFSMLLSCSSICKEFELINKRFSVHMQSSKSAQTASSVFTAFISNRAWWRLPGTLERETL